MGRAAIRFVYVAGPYSSPTKDGVEASVAAAVQIGVLLLDKGLYPYIPHLSHHVEAAHPRPYEIWMALDLAWISRCDALIRLPGRSPGADREVGFANARGIPVFDSVDALLSARAAA